MWDKEELVDGGERLDIFFIIPDCLYLYRSEEWKDEDWIFLELIGFIEVIEVDEELGFD